MVVDDGPIVGKQAADILEDIGVGTTYEESEFSAIEKVKNSLNEEWMFDIAMAKWQSSAFRTTARKHTMPF